MTEEFLHYIWKFKLFDQFQLSTTNNENVEIVRSGDHNFDAGPDFFNAKIKVDNTIWAGNVEVHINASDWNKHNHQTNKAYDNIILHVVNNADEKLFRNSGEEIPTIELKHKIDHKLYHNYTLFKSSASWIPCEKQISSVPPVIINNALDKMLLERLEKKSEAIINSLKLNNNNWEETFYQLLARNFGFKTNSEAFELLAKSLPLNVLGKQKSSLFQIEALLFGNAGMLEKHFEDKYPLSLQNEYIFLKQKFKLCPIDTHLWRFLRMRPVNFPSIRIAQFADLIFNSSNLFSKILEIKNVEDLKILLNISVSEYWETHYLFDRSSAKRSKHMGDEGINNIIINTIVPFLFVYGKQRSNEEFVDRALLFLETISSENNAITISWSKLNLPVNNNAYSSQALIQLKNEYCVRKKCLSCNIGNYLIKNN